MLPSSFFVLPRCVSTVHKEAGHQWVINAMSREHGDHQATRFVGKCDTRLPKENLPIDDNIGTSAKRARVAAK